MNTRDEILSRLKPQQRTAPLPAPWVSRRQFDDPAGRFADSLAKVKGQAIRVRTLDDALAGVGELLAGLGARSVVMNDEPPVGEIHWAERFPEIQFRTQQQVPDRTAWRGLCAAAEAGITSADAALAETGTLVISSGPGRSRLVPLLPAVHIALVPLERLTTDIFTWLGAHHRQFPANTVLVSGPSKTADIEQTMSVGVHGPKQLIVFLLDC